MYTADVFAFNSADNLSFGASLNPSGKTNTAPTFKPPYLPFPKICFLVVS